MSQKQTVYNDILEVQCIMTKIQFTCTMTILELRWTTTHIQFTIIKVFESYSAIFLSPIFDTPGKLRRRAT